MIYYFAVYNSGGYGHYGLIITNIGSKHCCYDINYTDLAKL